MTKEHDKQNQPAEQTNQEASLFADLKEGLEEAIEYEKTKRNTSIDIGIPETH